MFGKYNGFVSKARVSACMYFLVIESNSNSQSVYAAFVDERGKYKTPGIACRPTILPLGLHAGKRKRRTFIEKRSVIKKNYFKYTERM
jgi:hypothetical protein